MKNKDNVNSDVEECPGTKYGLRDKVAKDLKPPESHQNLGVHLTVTTSAPFCHPMSTAWAARTGQDWQSWGRLGPGSRTSSQRPLPSC